MKLIKLTESMTGGDTKQLILNTAYVTHIQQGLNGKDAHIRMSDFKTYYFVKESVDQVWRMINGEG